MKLATLALLLLASFVLATPVVAQQVLTRAPAAVLPATPVITQQPRASHERKRLVDPRLSTETFQILGFTISTGGDDLRDDSIVSATLLFPDGTKQDCQLHGDTSGAQGANLTWGNNSSHDAPPCRLQRPFTLPELRQSTISIGFPQYGGLPYGNSGDGILTTSDNWDINRIEIIAYNPGSAGKLCVFDISGGPLARLTRDSSDVTISDFPNQCR